MADILRGEVYWANLDPTQGQEQSGQRPVLILSRDSFNKYSGTVIAVALTSQKPKAAFPFTFELSSNSLPKKSWVKITQVRTLSVLRLAQKIGDVPLEEIEKVIAGLNEILSS
jgi:mRNA interferase MazF